jgi:transposase
MSSRLRTLLIPHNHVRRAPPVSQTIVRRDTGEDWQQYVVGLMQEQGVIAANEEPTDEEVRRFDKKRKNKKVSNEDWESTTDADARIAKLKDGRTHLAYKAEHVVDLDSELIVAAEVYHADQSDSYTLLDSVMEAQGHLREATGEMPIAEVAADKGYHAAEPLELAGALSLRTYIPEPERQHPRRWTDKPPELKAAVYANRRRTKTDKGKRLQRLRSERVERSFAHVCETGGARRTWLCGIEKVRKRLLMSAFAHNLGVLMRALFSMGTPRGLQKEGGDDDGLASLLRLARLVIPSFRTALATFGMPTSNLHQQTTRHAADALAA